MPAGLIGFLVMSFADGIGVAMGWLCADYDLPVAVRGVLPSLIFLWFLVLSVPVGGMCVRFGRRRIALVSLLSTAVAMFLPVGAKASPVAVFAISFALLGISNVGLQVSLPPFVVSVPPSKSVAGRVMACLAVKTGMAAAIPAVFTGCALLGDWTWAFPAGAVLALVAATVLSRTPVSVATDAVSAASYGSVVRLMADPAVAAVVLFFALAICQDVGLNLVLPGLLRSFYGWEPARQGLGTSVYFLAKIPAMLMGAWLLPRVRPSSAAVPCVVAVVVGLTVLFATPSVGLFFAALLLVSFGSANFYGIAFGILAERHPTDLDRLSSLLVMSISSAALVAPVLAACGWRF